MIREGEERKTEVKRNEERQKKDVVCQVRAAAVSALAKFGAQCPTLRPSIEVLLKRCLLDSDDEVMALKM